MTKELKIYPAIDILEGKCVRLFKGDYAQSTSYGDDPVDMAKRWRDEGAEFLHVVDLDGAKEGRPVNLSIIEKISSTTGLPVQTGGGIRNREYLEQVFESGIARAILGSSAIKDPDFTKTALEEFGEQIVIGMDTRGGKIAVEGWLEDSDVSAIDLANEMKKHGLKLVVYTDIEKDGTLAGPNINALREFADSTGIATIASGGMSKPQDIEDLKSLVQEGVPLDGVIIGKALYTGDIKLMDLSLN